MPRPALFLRPENGLCNRMRTIMFWSAFADAINRDFHIVWEPSEGFDETPYQELFDVPSAWTLHQKEDFDSIKNTTLDLNQWNSPEGESAPDYHQIPSPSDFGFRGRYEHEDLSLTASGASRFDLYREIVSNDVTLSVLKHFLKPCESILQEVEILKEQFSPEIIGLHIRGNDALSERNENSFRYDTRQGFKKWHDVINSSSPDTTFFLSTDEETVEEEFKETYGKRIITQEFKPFYKTETWETKPGQRQALIDLYCLGLTSEIVGTSWSSYTELAKLYLSIHQDSKPL